MNLKKTAQYLLIFAIGGIFLYFVFKDIEWKFLLEKIQQANYYYIGIGMLISIISHYLRALRAVQLYLPIGFTVQTKNSFYAVLIGYMMNYIIPRAGEVSRCAVLAKTNHMPIEKSLGTVVTERLVDLLMLALIIVFVFFLRFDLLFGYVQENSGSGNSSNSGLFQLVVLLLAAILIYVLWLNRKMLLKHALFNRIIGVVKGFSEGLLSIKKVKSPVMFIILSAGIWVCYILMMYFCLFGMESTAQLNFTECLVVFAMGTIGVVIPAPGAGAGTYHFAVMTALTWFGVPKDDGIAYATIVHGLQMIILLAFGAVASVLVLFQQKKQHQHA